MAETTGIAWCDSTFNPWLGCTKISPGCDGCYAAVSTPARALGVAWGAGQPRRRTSDANWRKPLTWQKHAERGFLPDGKTPHGGRRPRVFCASLADVFDNEVDPAWRSDLFILISETPGLDWLLLTKRIGNAKGMLPVWYEDPDAWAFGNGTAHPNVWLGASVVNQEEADRDIPKLLATPAAKRFVSYEPALGPVLWPHWLGPQFMAHGQVRDENTLRAIRALSRAAAEQEWGTRYIDWIIIGGESAQGGHAARPFDIAWARDTVRQCRAAGVAVFVKQMGSRAYLDQPSLRKNLPIRYLPKYSDDEQAWIAFKDRAGADPAEWPADLRVQEFPA